MDSIGRNYGFQFVYDLEKLTFSRMEIHIPFYFPILKVNKVFMGNDCKG